MFARLRVFIVVSVTLGLLLAAVPMTSAQKVSVKPKKVITAKSPEKKPEIPDTVVIERESLHLISPKKYQVPLQLEPAREVQLVALTDGVIRAVQFKPGQQVRAQTEAVRLDNREDQLLLVRAKAKFQVAQIGLKQANAQKDPDLVALAQAKQDAAKAELDLAQFRFDRNSVKVPFAGQVFRAHVSAGQFVRAGQPLMRLGDTTKLKVEIPVNRTKAAVGKSIAIRIEQTTTQAKIAEILPLAPRFEPLRDLINSAASAVVYIDNPDNQFKVGQAVFAPLIPRYVVTEVLTASLSNLAEGGRKLQVVRNNVIRDVEVRLHGQVGVDRIFVSGSFAEGDEVIVSSSHDLPDGTQIRLSSVAAAQSQSTPKRTTPKRASF